VPLEPNSLLGENDLTIDPKNRLQIPASIREKLDGQSRLLLMVGGNRRLWLYPKETWDKLVVSQESHLAPGARSVAFDHKNFGLAQEVEIDGQGRILLPEKHLRRTKLSREITMVGARDRLELWDRNDWEAHVNQIMEEDSARFEAS
jgi:MraZ protein